MDRDSSEDEDAGQLSIGEIRKQYEELLQGRLQAEETYAEMTQSAEMEAQTRKRFEEGRGLREQAEGSEPEDEESEEQLESMEISDDEQVSNAETTEQRRERIEEEYWTKEAEKYPCAATVAMESASSKVESIVEGGTRRGEQVVSYNRGESTRRSGTREGGIRSSTASDCVPISNGRFARFKAVKQRPGFAVRGNSGSRRESRSRIRHFQSEMHSANIWHSGLAGGIRAVRYRGGAFGRLRTGRSASETGIRLQQERASTRTDRRAATRERTASGNTLDAVASRQLQTGRRIGRNRKCAIQSDNDARPSSSNVHGRFRADDERCRMGDMPFRQLRSLGGIRMLTFRHRAWRYQADLLHVPTGVDRRFTGSDPPLFGTQRIQASSDVASGKFGIASETKLAELGRCTR